MFSKFIFLAFISPIFILLKLPYLFSINFAAPVSINSNFSLLKFRRRSQYETIDWSVFQLPTNLHLAETPVNVVIVHIEVVTLEGMSVHSRINRVQVYIFLFVFFEQNDHLVSSNNMRLEDNVVFIHTNFASRNVRRVIVSSKGNLPVEKELQRGLAPGKVRVLSSVQIPPDPVLGVLRYVLLKKRNRISQRSRHVVGAVVFPFVLWISCLTKNLEVRFVTHLSHLN